MGEGERDWTKEVGPLEDERPTVLKGGSEATRTVEWFPSQEQARDAVEAAKIRDSAPSKER